MTKLVAATTPGILLRYRGNRPGPSGLPDEGPEDSAGLCCLVVVSEHGHYRSGQRSKYLKKRRSVGGEAASEEIGPADRNTSVADTVAESLTEAAGAPAPGARSRKKTRGEIRRFAAPRLVSGFI
jgi:hypothetical protein